MGGSLDLGGGDLPENPDFASAHATADRTAALGLAGAGSGRGVGGALCDGVDLRDGVGVGDLVGSLLADFASAHATADRTAGPGLAGGFSAGMPGRRPEE